MATSATNILEVNGTIDTSSAITELHLADGRIVHLPTHLLTGQEPQPATSPVVDPPTDSILIPLVEEQLAVSKHTAATGAVHLEKTVQTYETTIDETLAHITWRVDRITLNQPVDAPPPVRVEGDTTIYPLLEEQLILTKQLILKEEVRVTREVSQHPANQTVTLRREHLTVHRDEGV